MTKKIFAVYIGNLFLKTFCNHRAAEVYIMRKAPKYISSELTFSIKEQNPCKKF